LSSVSARHLAIQTYMNGMFKAPQRIYRIKCNQQLKWPLLPIFLCWRTTIINFGCLDGFFVLHERQALRIAVFARIELLTLCNLLGVTMEIEFGAGVPEYLFLGKFPSGDTEEIRDHRFCWQVMNVNT